MAPSISPFAQQQPDHRLGKHPITSSPAPATLPTNELGLQGISVNPAHLNVFSSDQPQYRPINSYQSQIPLHHPMHTSFSAIPLENHSLQLFYHQSSHHLLYRPTSLINSLDLNLNQIQRQQDPHQIAQNSKKRPLLEDQADGSAIYYQIYPSPDPPKKAKMLDGVFTATQTIPVAPSANQFSLADIGPSFAQTPLPLSPQSPFLPNVMPTKFPPLNVGYDQAEMFDDSQFSPAQKISPVAPRQSAAPPIPSFKPIAIPKKPTASKKEPVPPAPSLELPHKIDSDNGKRSWELIKSIGKGGCGEVYLGRELLSHQPAHFVAIKIIKDRKQFLSELATMKTLNDHEYGRGYTPKLIMALKKRKALVMEYLSDTISARFERSGYHFSLKTICMLAMNMMSLVRDFNEKTGQAHVDIKPSNLCTSPNGRDLFLIDFGYSTSPHVKLPGQTGTPLFMACNLQTIGATYPSLQDDYESIGYVLMFLIGGGKKGLPWGSFRTHKEIASSKNDSTIRQFCQKLLGTEFEPLAQTLSNFIFTCRDRTKLFTSAEYNQLYNDWANVLQSCGWTNDKMYDWVEQDSAFNSTLTLINSQSIGNTPKIDQKIMSIKNTLRKKTV